MHLVRFAFIALMLSSVSAQAREFCAQRPGQTSSPCTAAPGAVYLELGIADWSHDSDADQRVTALALGDMQMRSGIDPHTEIGIGWTPFSRGRLTARATGDVTHTSGIGAISLSAQRSFGDAADPLFALGAGITIPMGKGPGSSEDWEFSLIAPISFELSPGVGFDITPELSFPKNEQGDGRHAAFGASAGIGFAAGEKTEFAADIRIVRDDDPFDPSSAAIAGLSVSHLLSDKIQLDAGALFGVNRSAPDLQIGAGLAFRF